MNKQQGFTLVELMIVVAIIGILASIAMPAYSNYVVRSKITEATTNLAGLRVSMEQYYQDNRTYLNGANCGVAMPGSPAVQYFSFTCAATANTFTITATGGATMNGFAYTLNEANTKQTSSVPTGWSLPNPNSCWVTKQGGIC